MRARRGLYDSAQMQRLRLQQLPRAPTPRRSIFVHGATGVKANEAQFSRGSAGTRRPYVVLTPIYISANTISFQQFCERKNGQKLWPFGEGGPLVRRYTRHCAFMANAGLMNLWSAILCPILGKLKSDGSDRLCTNEPNEATESVDGSCSSYVPGSHLQEQGG